MNLPGVSFAIEAPSMSLKFYSDSSISRSTASSSCMSPSSGYCLHPFSNRFCSQGFVAVSPIPELAGNAEKNKGVFCRATSSDNPKHIDCARSTGSGVLRTESFKCAALGQPSDGGPELSKTAGEESSATVTEDKDALLVTGSPIVIVEAPAMLKTAEPMPMMRPNRGQIKAGDAGRVMDRRPKNMWAVRFAVGAYLIERKCFKPLDIQ